MRTYKYKIVFRGIHRTEHAHTPGQALHQAIEHRAFGPEAWRYWNKATRKAFGPLSLEQCPDISKFSGSQLALFN